MTTNFLKNLYFNQTLTDEEYEDIPFPRAELHTHVLYKSTQMFSFLGFALAGPITCLVKTKGLAQIASFAPKMAKRGFVAGLIFGPIMTELVIRNSTQDQIYDRSFRIRHNKKQLSTDRISTFGALAGLAFAPMLKAGLVTAGLAGYSLGFVGGMVAPAK